MPEPASPYPAISSIPLLPYHHVSQSPEDQLFPASTSAPSLEGSSSSCCSDFSLGLNVVEVSSVCLFT